MQTGGVAALALSCDDTVLLSAGRDGSLLAVANELAPSAACQQEPTVPAWPSALELVVAAKDDVCSSGSSPTLEQLKQAATADAKSARAAEALQELRAEVATLQCELEMALEANQGRLPRTSFTIDSGAHRCGPRLESKFILTVCGMALMLYRHASGTTVRVQVVARFRRSLRAPPTACLPFPRPRCAG